MNRTFFWAALVGGAYALLASRPSCVRVSVPVEADPESLLNLVAQVEREPEFIPFVEAVQVERREGEEMRYRVEVRAAGIPGWARFQKSVRPADGRAEWTTLDGVLGFDQRGRFVWEGHSAGGTVTVTTTTRFHLPLIGPILAHLSAPALAFAFTAWVKNLDAAVNPASRKEGKPASSLEEVVG